ncbi:MAG: NUDIX domain-containing protein [SAR324 cluster bacterium]
MKPFRPNVCAVIVDEERGRVLVFRRVGRQFTARPWQFPQGGLHKNEAPEPGLLRELKEEIGTANVEIVRRLARPIRYVYPPAVARQLERERLKMTRFRGQEQHWFLVKLLGKTSDIHFNHEPREFCGFRWVTPRQAATLVVPFKREAYLRALRSLGLIRPPPRAASSPAGLATGSHFNAAPRRKADRR